MTTSVHRALFAATTALTLNFATTAHAQDRSPSVEAKDISEIVVTARRRQEALQDVPISISVYDQQQLNDRNVVAARDLAIITPSLSADSRYGDDHSTFSIRGFNQELRSQPSVAVYFADVVAPRAPGNLINGDGAGPGSFFDLQNVQVLKGPQGTLFGRNTTGGAVLLVPQRPTNEFEGYIEGSVGSYDMRRVQGVLNLPLNDRARLRVGIDRMEQDGYMHNVSGIGPKRFADVDYISLRASLVLDITPDLENYTIATYTKSDNSGPLLQLIACNNASTAFFARIFAPLCTTQLGGATVEQTGDFYRIQNHHPDPRSDTKTYQIINTTTWEITDNLTVKNIFSYAHTEGENDTGIWGLNFLAPTFTGGVQTGQLPLYFTGLASPTTFSQKNFVEELQVQGTAFDSRLTWQAGLYWEKSKPDKLGNSTQPGNISCDYATLSGDPSGFRCNNYTLARGFGFPGGVTRQITGTTFTNKAVYAQGTYKLSDQFSLTAGIRYSDDKTDGEVSQVTYRFPGSIETGAGYFATNAQLCSNPVATLPNCFLKISNKSNAPTWLLGLDYHPVPDTLLYAKYARGYRQGSILIIGFPGLNTFGPEKVDTYEVGMKTGFRGDVHGTFNIAAFYNDFRGQQISFGISPIGGQANTAIVNAGASTIWGVELDTTLNLFEGFTVSAGYSYLNSNVDKIVFPTVPPGLISGVPTVSTDVGEPLSYTPKHKVQITGAYDLPMPDNVGDLTISATYVFTDKMQATARRISAYAVIPSYQLLNLNLNWRRIGGSDIDGSLFVTNALKEKYRVSVIGTHTSTGFEVGTPGKPRMAGVRLRYNFH